MIALTAVPGHADDVVVGVAPASLEMTLTPGSVASPEITVFNPGRHPVRISAAIEQDPEGAANPSAVDWLRVEPGDFLMAGFGERTITVIVEVPEGELPSGDPFTKSLSYNFGGVESRPFDRV